MISRLAIVLVCFCAGLRAQSAYYQTFKLENGAQVIYTTYSEVHLKDHAQEFGTAKVSGNTIERTMTDGSNHTWLGFQLHIERIPGDNPIRFNLSMEPLGGWGFFGQKATPRVIENGDRILLDVLQEPGTGRKLFDSFQVGIGIEFSVLPMTKHVPQPSAAGTVIHLQAPRLQKSGTTSMISLGSSETSISGAMAAVTLPGTGRFTFSSHAEPGFRMEAIGEGNKLNFSVGRAMYMMECAGPVVDASGSWFLWVKFEPNPPKRADVPALELIGQEGVGK